MTVRLYMPRVSIDSLGITAWTAMDRLGEVSRWVEAQFGRADYHTTYGLDFADYTDDWACFTFYDDTLGFWTENRWGDWMLGEAEWYKVREAA